MSDSETSSHESDGELPPEETLIHGRARRSTAGNRMSYLLQHYHDEDMQHDLVAEDEDDQRDFVAADDDDGDVELESSSDSEDEGPPKDGDTEALEGEKELQKQERADARKKTKRKAADIFRVPQVRKRVRLGEDDTATAAATPNDDSSTTTSRPRKKSERLSWIPSAEDAPARQSLRKQTIRNKEQTLAKLEESRIRSVKAHELMKIAAEKKAAEALPALTQADRMARALKIEKENSKSLNKWEKSEEERLRRQREQIEKMRNRKLEGPVITHWTGSVIWEGDHICINRVHRPKIEVVDDVEKKPAAEDAKPVRSDVDGDMQQKPEEASSEPTADKEPGESNQEAASDEKPKEDNHETAGDTTGLTTQTGPETATDSADVAAKPTTDEESAPDVGPKQTHGQSERPLDSDDRMQIDESVNPGEAMSIDAERNAQQSDSVADTTSGAPAEPAFLDGIHFWASQAPQDVQATASRDHALKLDHKKPDQDEATSNDATLPAPVEQPQQYQAENAEAPVTAEDASSTGLPSMAPTTTTTTATSPLPPASPHLHPQPTLDTNAPPTPSISAPPLPLLREQALRSLTILQSFPSLTTPPSTSKPKPPAPTTTTTAISSILLPAAHPPLTPSQSRYLTSKPLRKKGADLLPPAPPKPLCPVTAKVARFKDPKTGLVYRDLAAYKMLQRVVVGGTAWSAVFGSWMGPVCAGPLGRVAKGVPEAFWTGVVEEKDVGVAAEVKVEEQTGVETKGDSAAKPKALEGEKTKEPEQGVQADKPTDAGGPPTQPTTQPV